MEKIYYSFINLDNEKFDFKGFQNSRIDYINSFPDLKSKNQSYFVWKLLLLALKDFYFSHDLNFDNSNGKWYIKDCNIKFCLSHSDNLVSVVVGDSVVGVDVERISDKILKLEKRYVKDNIIQSFYNGLNDYEKKFFLTKKWTENECKFKSNNAETLVFSTVINDNFGANFVLSCTSKETPVKIEL